MFVLNLLQKRSTETGLSLRELQVIIDWLCVTDVAEISLKRFVTVAYLKK